MIMRMQMRVPEGDSGLMLVIFLRKVGAQMRMDAGYLGCGKRQGKDQNDGQSVSMHGELLSGQPG